MEQKYCIITTACSSEEEAEKISSTLLNKRLAACIQQTEIRSSYHWKDKIETEPEIGLSIKTRSALFAEVARTIKEESGYETPEIIATPVIDGSEEYLRWISQETRQSK